jgi:hypothetical protein
MKRQLKPWWSTVLQIWMKKNEQSPLNLIHRTWIRRRHMTLIIQVHCPFAVEWILYIYFGWTHLHISLIMQGRYEDVFTREKSYFPRATPEENITISRVNKSSYHPYAREINVLFHQATFWWILPNEIFWPSLITKLLFRNISGVNTVIWPKR